MLNTQKVNDHINSFISDDDTHPELRRFLKDFSIQIEFGQFDGEEDEFDEGEFE